MTGGGSCPRDGTPLEQRVAGPSAYGACPACNGLRFEAEALRTFLEDCDDSWNVPREAPGTEAQWTDPSIRCPCGAEMREISRSGVRIDVCPDCRSVWLDGGEIASLMKRPAARRTGSKGDVAYGALEFVARALEWIYWIG